MPGSVSQPTSLKTMPTPDLEALSRWLGKENELARSNIYAIYDKQVTPEAIAAPGHAEGGILHEHGLFCTGRYLLSVLRKN